MASLFKALEAVTSVYQNLFVAYRAVAQKPLRYFLQNLNKFSKEQSFFFENFSFSCITAHYCKRKSKICISNMARRSNLTLILEERPLHNII